MTLRRFLTAYYAYVVLIELMLGYGIYTIWFEASGMGVWEIALLFALWTGVAALFEMPSGALSDRFDRRWLLVAAPVIKAVTFLLWVFAEGSFAWFAAGFVVWSFSMALVSGSKEALLYEHMAAAGREGDYDKALGRDRAATELSIGIAVLVGAIVGDFSMTAALWMTLPPLALAAVAALWLRDIRREAPAEGDAPRTSYLGHFANAFRAFRTQAELRFLALYLMFGMMLFGVIEEFDPLYLISLGLPIWGYGVLGGLVIAVRAFANLIAHRFAHAVWLGWATALVGGALLILAGIGDNRWQLVPFVLAYLVTAPAIVLAEARFQSAIDNDSRATTTSAMVFFYCLTGIVMCLLFGLLAGIVGVVAAYGWCGAYLMVFSLWVWRRGRRGQRITD